MPFVDLLRITVLLAAAVATALGAISVLVAAQSADHTALIVAGAWWLAAAIGGGWLGRSARAAQATRRVLAGARTATSLPPESPGRITFLRLWPVGAFALLAGGLAAIAPQVAAIRSSEALPSERVVWQWRSPRMSATSTRRGSVPAAAAAISPVPSRSSG